MSPISLDHCRDVSTPWLESTCDKLNWKSTHLSIKGLPAHKCISEGKPSHEFKGTASRAQRQDCIAAQIWGRLQNISAALKIPKSTVASIILKWKMFGTTRTLPRAGRPAQSNWWRRGLSRLVTKNLMVTLIELHDHVEMNEDAWKHTWNLQNRT